jgi:transcription initiation factor TFIIB
LVSPIDASIFIDRYAAELDLSESTHQTALDIAEADGGMSGSNPSVGAARCIWVAIKQSGEDVRQKDLLNISGTTGPSIRRKIDELEAKI